MENVYIQLQLFIKQLEEKHIIFYSATTFISQPISLINQTETNSLENCQEPKVNIQCHHYPLCHPLLIKADTFSNKPWITILVQTLNCTKEESRGVGGGRESACGLATAGNQQLYQLVAVSFYITCLPFSNIPLFSNLCLTSKYLTFFPLSLQVASEIPHLLYIYFILTSGNIIQNNVFRLNEDIEVNNCLYTKSYFVCIN